MSSSKPYSLRRPALVLLLAGVLSCTTFLLGSCSDESASSPDTTVPDMPAPDSTIDPSFASFYTQACWDPDSLTVERQTQETDLIIVGEIVQIDASAWNRPRRGAVATARGGHASHRVHDLLHQTDSSAQG